jgi:hypothetical protein
MRHVGITFALLFLVAVLAWYYRHLVSRREYQGTTLLTLSGATGVVVVGHYVRHGQPIAISNTVPWTLSQERVSSFELRKLHPDEVVTVQMRYHSESADAQVSTHLEAGVLGLRARVQNGFITQEIPK